MPIFNLFSKRRAAEEGAIDDVYQYTEAPEKLRVQISHIFTDAIGNEHDFRDKYSSKKTAAVFEHIVHVLRREYGVFRLGRPDSYPYVSEREELLAYLLTCPLDHFLDILELAARLIENECSTWPRREKVARDALTEINIRLRESRLGYQFEAGHIIKFTTEFAHQEITKPAIQILSSAHLAGARQEFLSAHSHYRERRYKECITDCLKSLESTIKVIAARRGWQVPPTATAKGLIDACFANQLVPEYMQAEFNALRSLLESGIPTTRNRTSGHGQGPAPISLFHPG